MAPGAVQFSLILVLVGWKVERLVMAEGGVTVTTGVTVTVVLALTEPLLLVAVKV